jgi:hypothetical protein
MTLTYRRVLAAGALTAAALGTTAVGPAMADETTPSLDCAAATAAVTTAKADFVVARKAFVASHRPLGRLMAAERASAHTEVRTSRATIRQLHKQAASTRDQAIRAALRGQIAEERADIRHASRLLESKAALRIQAVTDRNAARTAFASARAAFVTAQNAATTACGDA